jgi:hypothetical protein
VSHATSVALSVPMNIAGNSAVGHRASEIVNDSGAEVDQRSPSHRSCRPPLINPHPVEAPSVLPDLGQPAARAPSQSAEGYQPPYSGVASLSGPIKSAALTAAATTDHDIVFGIYEVAASTGGLPSTSLGGGAGPVRRSPVAQPRAVTIPSAL